ncbi:MAG: protein kinase [Legionellales bacterium]|nr:protein kinase [Legionellales bacterium]
MPITKQLEITYQDNNIIISAKGMETLRSVFERYTFKKNAEIHSDDLYLFSIPHAFDEKLTETKFILSPISADPHNAYILYSIETNKMLPPHIKKINHQISIDKITGQLTLEKLDSPKIMKKIEINADTEFSDDEFDSDSELYGDKLLNSEYSEKNIFLDNNVNIDSELNDNNLSRLALLEIQQGSSPGAVEVSSNPSTPLHISSDSILSNFSNTVYSSSNSTDADEINWDESDTEAKEFFVNEVISEEGDEEYELFKLQFSDQTTPNFNVFPKKKSPILNSNNFNRCTFFKRPSGVCREVSCNKQMNGNNTFFQHIATEENWSIISDFIHGKSLSAILKDKHIHPSDYSNERILNLMKITVQAAGRVHSNNIIHGDLKPENIIIAPDETKATVIDFDGSVNLSAPNGAQKKIKEFTDLYVAPEQRHEMDSDALTHNKALDVYAVGLVLLVCLGYYDASGLRERQLKFNLLRNKGTQYDVCITRREDHINYDPRNQHDCELDADLHQLATTLDSFGKAGEQLQTLFDRLFSRTPEKRGNLTQLLNDLTDIENDYLASIKPRRNSI